jgi:hypothetical protein|tara:strand:+ start:969 stop:1178 length:210 start_codon:yes stop_codon:yes gene_type:complete
MKPALVLKEMKELRESWRKQGFSYSVEQQKRFDQLLKLRRERVKWFHDNDRVQKGAKKTVEKVKKEEET